MFWLIAFTVIGSETDSPWYERSWQSAEGLPDNNVVGVAQTKDGYLWVATAGGLMRFDGVRFQEFPLAGLDGVPNRVVHAMYLDKRGWLWLGMDRGPVVRIAPDATEVFTNVPDERATCITEDSSGAIWLTYAEGGLTRIKDHQVTVFNTATGWEPGGTTSLASDNAGQVWFAKGNQIGVFENGKFNILLTLPETVGCIGQRHKGGIWICAGRRILCYEQGSQPQEFGKLPSEPDGIEGSALFEDRTGVLWIGTDSHGLFRCTGANAVQVPTSYSEIASLTQDQEDNLWVGTAGGGLDRLRPRIIELLGTESGLPYESIRSVCEDPSGTIWAATQNGLLAHWQNGVWNILPPGTNGPSGNFSCVLADQGGGLWIGTRDHGLYHVQNGRSRNWRQSDGLSSDDVRSVLESSNGDIYLTTDNPSRVQRLHEDQLQPLQLTVQVRSIRALTQDTLGQIWAGSADGRLLCVKGNQLVDETPGVTNRLLSIRCLYAAPDGSLWIGYAGWGIGWLKDGHYARITSEQGLYDDYISQIVEDDRGWLWCACNRGIFEVSLQQLEGAARESQTRVRSIAYSRGEGFPNLQANYENVPGAFRGKDGRLWFPMQTGLAVIHPDRVPIGTTPPPVLLERVTVDKQVVALYDPNLLADSGNSSAVVNLHSTNVILRLPPRLSELDFEFTALSFTTPENVEFEYRLQGLDDSWIEGNLTRYASYSRLPHGHYNFQVRACNIAGVWSPAASLNFEVLPFYWQTWWFRLFVFVTFTAGVVTIVRYVSFRRLHDQLRLLEQQAALQKERARIAKDIHDDLGADLTQIAFLGELAQQDRGEPEKVADRIGTISMTARQAVKSLDEIVWAINPRNDTLQHLIDYVGSFALDYLRPAGIRCRLNFPEQIPARALPTNVRHNFFLVIKEALHNIVKHANASEIRLQMDLHEEILELVIEDNGCGFAEAPDNALADGLRNMRQRMTELGGEYRIDSRLQIGTQVILRLPLRAA
ncbi:MAG TPA: two-component regulator propeller domain-containing protein [Verrucomicrobiae bacterium]